MTQPSPRRAARTALARIGTSLLSLLCVSAWCQEPPKKPLMSVEEAILALDSPNAQVQYEAAFSLAKSGAKAKPAVPTIVEILNRGGEDVRPDLLWVLVALGPDAQEAVPALIKTAESPNFHARYITACALGRIGPAAQPAVPVLLKMLADDVTSGRRHAAEALGNLGPNVAPEAVPLLIAATKDPAHMVKEQAVLAVGKFGDLGKVALPGLQEMAMRDGSTVRTHAVLSMWRLSQDAQLVLPVLKKLIHEGGLELDPPETVQILLAEMGPAAEPVVPDLVQVLEQDGSSRTYAAAALGKLGGSARSALPALRKLLDHPQEDVRMTAQEAISAIEAKPSTNKQ